MSTKTIEATSTDSDVVPDPDNNTEPVVGLCTSCGHVHAIVAEDTGPGVATKVVRGVVNSPKATAHAIGTGVRGVTGYINYRRNIHAGKLAVKANLAKIGESARKVEEAKQSVPA